MTSSTLPTEKREILYVRHAKSQSNRAGNTGVHIVDPMLMSGDEDRENGSMGQTYCLEHIAPKLVNETITHIAVSPLLRCLSTLVLSLPIRALSNVEIVVMPLLEEQTTWFSDRPRHVLHNLAYIRQLLRARGAEEAFSQLKINFSLMFAEEDSQDNSRIYKRFESISTVDDLNSFRAQQVELAQAEKLNKPWHTKTGIYHPERLQERGQACTAQLAHWMSTVLETKPDAKFAIFGHGGVASFITEEVGNIRPGDAIPKLTDWITGEVRHYVLEWRRANDQFEASLLRETEEHRRLRLGPDCQPYEVAQERSKADGQQQKIVEIAQKNLEDATYKALYVAAETEIPNEVQGVDESYLKDAVVLE